MVPAPPRPGAFTDPTGKFLNTLVGALSGAIVGGVIGGLDAVIHGRSFSDGWSNGVVGGAAFGATLASTGSFTAASVASDAVFQAIDIEAGNQKGWDLSRTAGAALSGALFKPVARVTGGGVPGFVVAGGVSSYYGEFLRQKLAGEEHDEEKLQAALESGMIGGGVGRAIGGPVHRTLMSAAARPIIVRHAAYLRNLRLTQGLSARDAIAVARPGSRLARSPTPGLIPDRSGVPVQRAIVAKEVRATGGNEPFDPVIDTNVLIDAYAAFRKGLSARGNEATAWRLVTNPSYKWVVDPTTYLEFVSSAKIAQVDRIVWIRSLSNVEVLTASKANALESSPAFRAAFDSLRAAANKNRAGLGDPPLPAGPKGNFYNDIRIASFAKALGIPLVTGDSKFLNFLKTNGAETGIDAYHYLSPPGS